VSLFYRDEGEGPPLFLCHSRIPSKMKDLARLLLCSHKKMPENERDSSKTANQMMNTPNPLSREPSTSAKLNEKELQEFAMKAASASYQNTPRRPAVSTPRLLEMLARVEGVARWGLNE